MATLSSVRSALGALFICALMASLFESVFISLKGLVLPVGYMLLALVLTCAAALLTALPTILPSFSLAFSLGAFSAWMISTRMELWAAVLGGLGIWVICERGLRAGLSGRLMGACLGVALPFGLLVWPRVGSHVGLGRFDKDEIGFTAVIALLLCTAVQLTLSLLGKRARLGWVPVAVVLLPGLTVMSPFLTRGSHPERKMPHYEEGQDDGVGPSVLVLILDTVRADHLSIYGYERETTPELARFLEDRPRAVLYEMAFAPGTWTLPSHASLFTGLLPSEHAAHEGVMFGQGEEPRRPRLNAKETLAELAKRNGYRTAAVLANTVSLRADGMRRGLDWAFKPIQESRMELLGEDLRRRLMPMVYGYVSKPGPSVYRVNELVLQFIDSRDSPFLVFGNYAEAHIPYAPRPPFSGEYTDAEIPNWGPPKLGQPQELVEYLKGRYDEEILALDSGLGELFEELDQRGIFDRAWVIITSDHGEAFGEHGLTEHGTAVYNEITRIPLIVSPPKGESLKSTTEAVSLVDVTALISMLIDNTKLGVGRDLRQGNEQSVVRMEYFGNSRKLSDHGPLAVQPGRAVAIGHKKLLMQGDRKELYLLSEDPLEEHDRYDDMSYAVKSLTPELPDLTIDETFLETRKLSEREKADLRALGYLE